MIQNIALATVLLGPIFGGIGSLLVPGWVRRPFCFIITAILLGAAGTLALNLEETIRYEISGWASPLGITLHVDGLAAVMLLLASVVGSAVSVYSYGYYKDEAYKETAAGFWPLFFVLWGSLNAIFMVSDLFTVYVCLELITFASVALITIAKDREALEAALSYLMTALMGSLAYLLGVALIYSKTGTLDWTLVAQGLGNDTSTWVAISLMTMGLVIKAALYPLHFWLPGAHAIAPAPVSALLSALVVKAPFFVMLRLWVQTFPDLSYASHILGALGAGAIIWGSFQAIIQERVKLMVAYSTVAQLGYLFLLFPIVAEAMRSGDMIDRRDVWEGAIYFAISHGVAKASMFLVAGIVLQATKTDYLKDMQGAASRVPIAILVWALAGVSLIGLPPSGGFIAKWQLLTSAIRFGLWPYAVVILFGGLLASAYVFRVLWYAFLSPEDEKQPTKLHVPFLMMIATVFLGTTIIVMGVRTTGIFSILKIGSPFLTGGAL